VLPGEEVPPVDQNRSLRFPADVTHLASIRDFAERAARELEVAVDRDDLLVIVGELAANAAIHQGGEAEITVAALPHGLLVEVRDHDPFIPDIVHGDAWDADGHRGLFLVDALSQAWGVEPIEGGKRVWAVLGRADAGSDVDRRSASADGDASVNA
jgi:anti-sigma regulatory factor (Ser/Thr protein kinase)